MRLTVVLLITSTQTCVIKNNYNAFAFSFMVVLRLPRYVSIVDKKCQKVKRIYKLIRGIPQKEVAVWSPLYYYSSVMFLSSQSQ